MFTKTYFLSRLPNTYWVHLHVCPWMFLDNSLREKLVFFFRISFVHLQVTLSDVDVFALLPLYSDPIHQKVLYKYKKGQDSKYDKHECTILLYELIFHRFPVIISKIHITFNTFFSLI